MVMHGQIDDERLTRGFDRRLVRRLLGWGRPYKGPIALSVLIILVWTGLSLTIPFLTRKAIDDYLQRESVVLDWTAKPTPMAERSAIRSTLGAGHFLRVDGGRDLIRVTVLKRLDPVVYRGLLEGETISEGTYYFFREGDYTDEGRSRVAALAAAPPEGTVRVADGWAIPMKSLGDIPLEDRKALRSNDWQGLLIVVALMFGVLAVNFLIDYGRIYIMQYVGQRIMFNLRTKTFEHLQKMSLGFFDRQPVGRLVTRVTNDVEVLNEMFANVLVNMLRDLFVVAGIVVLLFVVDWRLALVALAALPFIIGLSFYFRILARHAFRLVRAKISKINAYLQENISGIQIIKLFNREEKNQRAFEGLSREYFGAQLRQLWVFSVFGPLVNVLSSAAIGLVIWYGGWLTLESTITLGTLVLFIDYVQRFFHPIRDMSEKYNMLQAAMASSERIFQILDEPEEIRDPGEPVPLPEVKGRIDFQDVWFAYEDENWVLKNISFTVEPGRNLALVGATGAGKTSIISLLGRFYEVNRGRILVDGVDIQEVRQSDLRSVLGVVQQDVFIFSGNFQDNIRLKNKTIAENEVCRAAEYVMASGFIERYPDKYVEEVHERGSTLSAGERQLLAFARALAFDPRILILDEATANIDTETEEKIQTAIAKMMKGRTSIVIAHRLSTVQNMDRIAVMHKGEIVEMGTHVELMQHGGLYRNLIEIQALEAEQSTGS
jgi:ABC-type multidrug transport system fused ATPase/permease subunit